MSKKGKDALLLWCQRNTEGFEGVHVQNFHTSWRDGRAFCAIIAKFRPDKLDYAAVVKHGDSDPEMLANNALAFRVAEELGVPALLDAEDMLISRPEQFSVITYLSQFYHHFTKMQAAGAAGGAAARPGAGLASITAPSGGQPSNAPKPSSAGGSGGSKAPVASSNVETCNNCGKELEGAVLEVLGKLWHQNCFCCTSCQKKLATKCLNVDGKPYCETCGKKAFAEKKRVSSGPDRKSKGAVAPPKRPAPKKALPVDDGDKKEIRPSRDVPERAAQKPTPQLPQKQPAAQNQETKAPVEQTAKAAPPSLPAKPKLPPKSSERTAGNDAPGLRSKAERDDAALAAIEAAERKRDSNASSGPKPAVSDDSVAPARPSKDMSTKDDALSDDEAPPMRPAPKLSPNTDKDEAPARPAPRVTTADSPSSGGVDALRTELDAAVASEDFDRAQQLQQKIREQESGTTNTSMEDDIEEAGPPKRPAPKAPMKPKHLTEYSSESDSDSEEEPVVARVSVRQTTLIAGPVAEQDLPNLAAFLEKKGDVGVIKSWKKRWCVLRRDRLVYYENEKSTEPLGHIPLAGVLPAAVQLISDDRKPGGFQITTTGPLRVWILRASSDEERDQWMAAVLKHAQFAESADLDVLDDRSAPGHATLSARADLLPDLHFERKEGYMERLHTGAAVGALGGKFGKKLSAASWTGSLRKKLKWNKRFFVLKDGILFKYNSQEEWKAGDAKPTKIALYGCEMEEYVDPAVMADAEAKGIDISQVPGYGRQFSITNKRTNIILRLDSEEEMQRWLNAILQHKILIHSLLDAVVA